MTAERLGLDQDDPQELESVKSHADNSRGRLKGTVRSSALLAAPPSPALGGKPDPSLCPY